MARTAILLDLDGTLVDSLADIAASLNHVRREHGLAPLPAAAVREMVGDGAGKLLERGLADLEDPPRPRDAFAIYEAHHHDQCTREVVPYPGVVETLQRWHAAGIALGVVTNKPERFARRILEHLDLDRYFGAVVGGDTTTEKKPSPVPLRAALAILGRPDGDVLMVGDGLQDLQAGKAAKVATAAVLYGFRPPELLRAEGADEYWERFGG